MKPYHLYLVVGLSVLASCSPAKPGATPVPITDQYSFAAQPWLADAYNCAGGNPILAEQRSAGYSDQQVDLSIRIGEPPVLSKPAYRIGTEQILVVVNRVTSITSLTEKQVKGLFSGQITDWSQIDPGKSGSVQVWVFPTGEDVQQIFEDTVLGGTPVTSLARLANTPDEMSRAVADDQNAIGLLPQHWKAGNVTNVFAAASVPVLAITSAQPPASVLRMVICLQK